MPSYVIISKSGSKQALNNVFLKELAAALKVFRVKRDPVVELIVKTGPR